MNVFILIDYCKLNLL